MAEKIINKIANEQFKEDYTRYGIYTLYKRVLSDYRDGLKPVHRRILVAMLKKSRAIGRNTVKSSAVVGDTMKYYHGHGEAGIYGAIKPMANWFESYIPLIHKQGNFGSFYGDPASASRYTGCSLSKFSTDVIFEELIENDDVVDWCETYDGKELEPEYLPCKIPLLLINGSFGIGVGFKAEIPTHNINEVIDATITLIDNPNTPIVLIPDHCMPCEIIGGDFKQISDTGFGKYIIRGKVDIEPYGNRTALVIKSIPNLTFLAKIAQAIDGLVEQKKLIQIERCIDENTEYDMRYVIVLKPGADPVYVKDMLYKNTPLEQQCRVNFETLNGLEPLRMSYRSYLLSFIDFRRMTKFRVLTNRLQSIQTRIHERDAYIKALESGEITSIISMIRKRKTTEDDVLIEYLMNKLKITDLQAKYIINCNIKRLSIGYLNKYKAEAAALEQEKNELLAHITDNKYIDNEIKRELLDIRGKYGKPRNCKIILNSVSTTNNVPRGIMNIVITERNFIKKIPEGVNIANNSKDPIKTVIKIDNADNILIFDRLGKVFKLPVDKVPFGDKNSVGVDIRFIIKNLTADIAALLPETLLRPASVTGKKSKSKDPYVISISSKGLFKRMDANDFIGVPASGLIYAKVDPDDFIQDITVAVGTLDLVVYSDKKVTHLNVMDVPYLKRNTKGSRSMYNADKIDGICVVQPDKRDIIVITESCKINHLSIDNLPLTKKTTGVNVIKLGSNDKIHSVVAVGPNDIIRVQTAKQSIEFKVSEVPYGSTISTGMKLFNSTRGDTLISCNIVL